MTRSTPIRHRLTAPKPLALLTGTAALTLAALTLAAPRGLDFPISLAEAGDRAEARFQELDADASGEISPAELAAAPKSLGRVRHGLSHRRMLHPGHGTHSTGKHGKRRGKRDAMDGQLFERLDENGDGLLSRSEFDPGKMREARRESMRQRVFEHLDADGSGGISRDELPDMSRHLEAMDADGDGTVTRQEARAHHQARQQARRQARQDAGGGDNG